MFDKGKKTIKEGIDTTNFEWKGAKEAVDKADLTCFGYMLYNSKFGKGVALACNDGCFYRLPSRYVADFENCSDADREYIMSGEKVEFRTYTTQSGSETIIAAIGGKDI